MDNLFLDRASILGADDLTPTLKLVMVPEWGGRLYIRTMTGKERERFEEAISSGTAKGKIRPLLASICICDEKGRSLFSAADVDALGEKSVKALNRVYEAAMSLNALGKEEVAALEKNSGAATSGATPSDSQPETTASTSTSS